MDADELGRLTTLCEVVGAIHSDRNKQRLNTRSYTEAKLVPSDNFLLKILWTKEFIRGQGYDLNAELCQVNMTTMRQKKVHSYLGKQSQFISIHYLIIKSLVEKVDLRILHCPTNEVVGDFFTKPLQISKGFKASGISYLEVNKNVAMWNSSRKNNRVSRVLGSYEGDGFLTFLVPTL